MTPKPNDPSPWEPAALRFVAIVVALIIAGMAITFIPDPTIKPLAAGLGAAAILALEEYIKNNN